MLELLTPAWSAPKHVHAAVTCRSGGVSVAPFDSLNLASHVGDLPEHVMHNRVELRRQLDLPSEPRWLSQIHGVGIVNAATAAMDVTGDGSFTTEVGVVCAVLTADCLPVLLTDRKGSCVAAVHAGWRGLAAGVIEAALEAMPVPNEQVMAWLGPAIGPDAFEVGSEVRNEFCDLDAKAIKAFQPQDDKWLADIYRLARLRLERLGVTSVAGGGLCTYRDEARFYSFRREGKTGRMASLIWMD